MRSNEFDRFLTSARSLAVELGGYAVRLALIVSAVAAPVALMLWLMS